MELNQMRDRQLKILNGQRPEEEERHLCQKGIFHKLFNIYETEGLFYKVFKEYEKLKKSYKGQYSIKDGRLKWNDGVNYLEIMAGNKSGV